MLIEANGNKYEGRFKSDKRHGDGKKSKPRLSESSPNQIHLGHINQF